MDMEKAEKYINSLSYEEREDLYNYLLCRIFSRMFAEAWVKCRKQYPDTIDIKNGGSMK